jgi:hypothetical protein
VSPWATRVSRLNGFVGDPPAVADVAAPSEPPAAVPDAPAPAAVPDAPAAVPDAPAEQRGDCRRSLIVTMPLRRPYVNVDGLAGGSPHSARSVVRAQAVIARFGQCFGWMVNRACSVILCQVSDPVSIS